MTHMPVTRSLRYTNRGNGGYPAGTGTKQRQCLRQVVLLLLCLLALSAAARAQAPAAPVKPTPVVPPPGVPLPEPIYLQHSFQLCCHFMIPGIISPNSPTTGSPSWPASIDSNLVPAATRGVQFYITPLPASALPGPGAPGRPPAGGTWPQSGVSTPLYVNFWTRQASLDGVTACCTITANSGTPITLDEVVYLDMLPIGVIYVPPGDPRATGGAIPKQTFTTLNAVQTSKTIITSSTSGSTSGLSVGIPGIALSQSGSTSTQTTTTDLQQQSMSVMTSAGVAQGPGGYPGQNDIVEVYLNPTFDVRYLGGYSYSSQIPPIPVSPVIQSISEHTAQPSDPGYPLGQWLKCPVQVQELLTGGPSATCLNDILTAPPQSALPVNPVTGTTGTTAQPLPLEERVLQMDPMVSAEYTITSVLAPPSSAPASPGSAPPSVLTDSRFLLLGGPGGGTNWSYCADPGPTPFSVIDTSLNSTTYSTLKKTTGTSTLTLNPLQLITTVIAAGAGGAGSSGSGAGTGTGTGAGGGTETGTSGTNSSNSSLSSQGWAATISFGNTWELDTTVTTSVQKTLTLSSTGNFGSGMTPLLVRSPAASTSSNGLAASTAIQFLRATWDGNPSNAWTANTTYPNTYVANGNFVLPTVDNTYVYQVKTGGVSGATEPTWCTTAGCTVKDGTVVWVLFGNTCEALTQFTTGEYYDQWSNTILFWTTPEPTGSALVTGSTPSSQPAN